jgi:hypothetical protein
MQRKKTLILILIVLITLNLSLLYILIGRIPDFEIDKNENLYRFDDSNFKIIDGGETIHFDELFIKTYIKGGVKYNKFTGKYEVPLGFFGIRTNKSIKIELDDKTEIIQVYVASKGQIPPIKEYASLKAKQLANLLEKRTPIIIGISYKKDVFEFDESSINCNEYCMNMFSLLRNKYTDTKDLIEALKIKKFNRNIVLGPISSLVIYEK